MFSPAWHSPVLSAPLPCHGCPRAGKAWPCRAPGQISDGQDWDQPHPWWRTAPPFFCGWRHLGSLSPWAPLCLPGDLPGSGHRRPGHVLATAGGGAGACPAAWCPAVLVPEDTKCQGRWHESLGASLQPHWLLFSDSSKVLPLFTAGVLQGRGEGGFTELCLHFLELFKRHFQLCASCLELPPPRWPVGL